MTLFFHWVGNTMNMSRNSFLLFFILGYLGFSSHGFSRESRWTIFGVRPLARGNTFVSIANTDYNALFYNPAGLARIHDWHMEILNPKVEISQSVLDIFNKMNQFNKTSDPAEIINLVKPMIGTPDSFAAGLSPYVLIPPFGIAIGNEERLVFTPHSQGNIDLEAYTLTLIPVGYAFSLLDGSLSLGCSIKTSIYTGVDETLGLDTLSKLNQKDQAGNKKIQDLVRSAVGIGTDFGLLFTPKDVPFKPTLGVSYMDALGTTITKIGPFKNPSPKDRVPTLNSGISFTPYETDLLYLNLAMENHMINHPIHYTHKLHMGAEFGIGSVVKLGLGLKDGYPTYGLQLDGKILVIRAASYVADHAAVVGTADKLAERRYAIQLKILI